MANYGRRMNVKKTLLDGNVKVSERTKTRQRSLQKKKVPLKKNLAGVLGIFFL